MTFYHIWADHPSLRPDGEHWTLQLDSLGDLKQQHFSGGLPLQADLDRLRPRLWADSLLGDAISASNFYDCFFVSERLRQLFKPMRLDEVYFFQRTLHWRGGEHPYYWMQTLLPGDPSAVFDLKKSQFFKHDGQQILGAKSFQQVEKMADYSLDWSKSEAWLFANAAEFDLFRLPGHNLGRGLFCSERLKLAIEEAGMSGLGFSEATYLRVSGLRKTPKPAPAHSTYRLWFPSTEEPDEPMSEEESKAMAGLRAKWNSVPDKEAWLDEYVKATAPQPDPEYREFMKEFFRELFSEEDEVAEAAQPAPPAPLDPDAWLNGLLDSTPEVEEDRPTLLAFMRRHLRTAFEAKDCWDWKPLEAAQFAQNPGTSRFYGQPFLPNGYTWPRSEDGQALLFVAQIKLDELPRNEELPPAGLLLFFLDIYRSTEGWPTEEGRSRVLFFEDTEGFALCDFPEDLPISADFDTSGLRFFEALDIPDDRYTEHFTDEEMPEKEAYLNFRQELDNEKLPDTPKLLGWPSCVQGYIGLEAAISRDFNGNWDQYEANKTQIDAATRQYRLLLQFPADRMGLSEQMGDPEVYFLLHEEDLRARAFERALVVLQCT